MTTATWTKDQIRAKLETSDRWLKKGISAIYAYQTQDEQYYGETVELNGVGFNGADAEFLSSLARQLRDRGTLSAKQIEWGRKKMLKYAGQLAKIANGKL